MGVLDNVTGVKVTQTGNTLANIWKGFDFIQHTKLYVGIPEENTSRDDDEPTNAQLMYIHNYGSPAKNIPARPVIEPAVNEPTTLKRIQDYVVKGIEVSLTGNTTNAEKYYKLAGEIAVKAVQEKFTDGSLAPNAPMTIRLKGSSTPLIDTGALRESITYVIRKE